MIAAPEVNKRRNRAGARLKGIDSSCAFAAGPLQAAFGLSGAVVSIQKRNVLECRTWQNNFVHPAPIVILREAKDPCTLLSQANLFAHPK